MTGSFTDWDVVGLTLLITAGTLVCSGAFIAMFWLVSLAEAAQKTRLYARVVNTLHIRNIRNIRNANTERESTFGGNYKRRMRGG